MKTTLSRQLPILLLLAMLLGIAFIPGVVPTVSAAAPQQATPSDKPTIVLIHGAWADGTGWQSIIPRLQRSGYTVVAAQLPLTSLADDVATAKRVLEGIEGPIVAVAHSHGGSVMTGAAAGNENVKALVYIAAFAPEANEPLGAYIGEYPTELSTAFVVDSAGFVYIDPSKFREIFAGDLSESKAAVMAAAQKPAFGHIFEESVEAAAWHDIPSWYMVATEDKTLHPDMERFYAERMGATIVEVESSHVAFISHPIATINLIEEAVAATAE
jgi:pimeloyl-ACP methyl ester carboxylesterase